MFRLKNWFVNFNMNFELRNQLGNFGTKFGILWQKFCEIDYNSVHNIYLYKTGTCKASYSCKPESSVSYTKTADPVTRFKRKYSH